jgi:hypothetical protein
VRSSDDLLLFINRALDEMTQIVSELGDELVNRRPALPNANSPYQILTHCLGVIEFWVGHLVAGRPNQRDREAEFHATGTVNELVARCAPARQRLREDIDAAKLAEPVRGVPRRDWIPQDQILTQEMVLFHVLEELCQHHGQMELTRDVLRASA